MKSSKLIPFLSHCLRENKPIFLTGEPGVGKTSVIEQAISDLGYESHIRHAVCMEPIDFRGFPCLERDKKDSTASYAHFVPYGDVKIMLEATEPVVFFYDDIGQSSQSVQKAMMALMLAREVNGKKISDHVRFIAATNRRGDGAGVGKIITPLISRQKCIVPFTLSVEDWIQWAHDNNMPPLLIAFIHFRGERLLLNFDPNKVDDHGNDLIQQPCPRTVANFGEWLNDGFDVKKDHEVFVGTIGEEFTREYQGFVDIYDKLGDMPNRICNGEKVGPPTDPASLYALSSCLASRSDDSKSWSHISSWSREYLPREYQQVLLLDAESMHKEKVFNTTEYSSWVCELKSEEIK
jgi:hypothetical protein